jgi:tetratricopeptide (TPR) repeat protein
MIFMKEEIPTLTIKLRGIDMAFFHYKAERKFDSTVQKHRPPIKDPMVFDLLDSQFMMLWESISNSMKSGKKFDQKVAESALEIADRLVEMEPLRALPWVNKSWILAALGRCEESLEANHLAIEIDPSDPEKWAFRETILRVVGRISEADEAAARAKELR